MSNYDDALTAEVKDYARELGSALTGIASADVLNDALEKEFRPEDVLPGCKSLVVMSLHIPDGALEIMRRGKAAYSYNLFGYAYLNRELNFIIYKMSTFIESKGYATTPVPARGAAYGSPRKGYGMISYRHSAVAAGLASFGLNGIALSKEYGSRQRFVALPTTAPLRPAEKILDQSEVCDGCLECVAHCPAGALTLNPPHECNMGGKLFRYARSHYDKCIHSSRGLSTKVWEGARFNPQVDVPYVEGESAGQLYDKLWNQRDGGIRLNENSETTYGATICGRCMAFCSAGHNAMKRRLRDDQKNTGWTDDLVITKDGTLKELKPTAKPLGKKLLGLED
jgi:epoxyqueuosine reductase QueG